MSLGTRRTHRRTQIVGPRRRRRRAVENEKRRILDAYLQCGVLVPAMLADWKRRAEGMSPAELEADLARMPRLVFPTSSGNVVTREERAEAERLSLRGAHRFPTWEEIATYFDRVGGSSADTIARGRGAPPSSVREAIALVGRWLGLVPPPLKRGRRMKGRGLVVLLTTVTRTAARAQPKSLRKQLGLPAGATADDWRRAWRRKRYEMHPDRAAKHGDEAEQRALAAWHAFFDTYSAAYARAVERSKA